MGPQSAPWDASMTRNRIVQGIAVLAAAAATLAVAPRSARACGQGGGSYAGLYAAIFAGAIAIGATDIGLTLWDAHSAGISQPPSFGYGVLEMLVAAPQFGLGLAGLTSTGSNAPLIFYTAWMGLLTTHAIWTIAKASDTANPALEAPAPGPPTSPKPLLQVSIGPTYVPVGQLAQT